MKLVNYYKVNISPKRIVKSLNDFNEVNNHNVNLEDGFLISCLLNNNEKFSNDDIIDINILLLMWQAGFSGNEMKESGFEQKLINYSKQLYAKGVKVNDKKE